MPRSSNGLCISAAAKAGYSRLIIATTCSSGLPAKRGWAPSDAAAADGDEVGCGRLKNDQNPDISLSRFCLEWSSSAPCSPRRAGFDQLVHDRIHQRLERGVDDVARDADRGPMLAGLVLALDQHAGDRLGAAVEDAHAIVREIEALDVFLVLAEILAQREVERVDRAVALGGGDQVGAVDRDLDDRERDRHALALGADALLDIDVELLHVEIIRHAAEKAARQELERGLRVLVG